MTRENTNPNETITAPEPTGYPREYGVNDIDPRELRRVVTRTRHVVDRDTTTSVESVYVMGSFAADNAMRVISDLDLRVVTTGYVSEETREAIETTLKNDHGPEIVPEVCGFLDVHITPAEPTADEPHVQIHP